MMMATRGSAISHAVLSKTDRPPFSIFPYQAHRQSAERPIIYPTTTTYDYNTPRKGPGLTKNSPPDGFAGARGPSGNQRNDQPTALPRRSAKDTMTWLRQAGRAI